MPGTVGFIITRIIIQWENQVCPQMQVTVTLMSTYYVLGKASWVTLRSE